MLVGLVLLVGGASGLAAQGFGKAPAKAKGKKAPVEAAGAGDPTAKWAACQAWAARHGAALDGVRLDVSAARGVDVVAERAFAKGDRIFGVPSALALALVDPEKATATVDVVDAGANFIDWYGANAKPFFAPYLATLAGAGCPTPDAWGADAVAAAEWPPLEAVATARRLRVREVSTERGLDFAALHEAAFIASSRSITIKMDGSTAAIDAEDEDDDAAADVGVKSGPTVAVSAAKPTREIRALVPMFDALNWSPKPNSRVEIVDGDKDESTFALFARRRIEAGEPLTISYGSSASSPDLLMNYGFVPPAFLDGSGNADARLAEIQQKEWSTTASQDRLLIQDVSTPQALREATRLKLALRSVASNKAHETLFKSIAAFDLGISVSKAKAGPLPPGLERNRVSSGRGKGGGAYQAG
ncbi:hypothetical protein M885DRAFT_559623 [Pelagophyceae sp. CCMP2097]|nr:hypothetical protein M885DRAFT_559623 [Pelagophyceae sp. CCMP2097]